MSETFIVRELDGVVADGGVQIDLLSLFGVVNPTVDAAARPWIDRLQRGQLRRGVAALSWWVTRRPLRLASSVALVCHDYRRRPALAVRALVTLVVACQHARTLDAAPVDHVHAHYATYPALAAWTLHRLLGLPYSLTAHAHDLYVDQSMLARKVADACFVVTISQFNRRYLAARTTAGEDVPVHVVHWGVDPSLYEFSAPTVRADGACGRCASRACRSTRGMMCCCERSPRARAGAAGARARGRREATLERLARQLAIVDRVLSRAAWTSSRRANACGARRRLRAGEHRRGRRADGGSSRRADGGDGVRGPGRQHARLSGIPELTVDGETGLFAEPSDVDGLPDALERLLAEPDAARYRAIRGRALVERDFDVRESGTQMAILFRGPAAPVQAHVNAT